jgi:hypothetical protein
MPTLAHASRRTERLAASSSTISTVVSVRRVMIDILSPAAVGDKQGL